MDVSSEDYACTVNEDINSTELFDDGLLHVKELNVYREIALDY